MRLEHLLRAHEFMRVERPPELWAADTELERLVPLLGEMLAAALAGGASLEQLTLTASNVVVGSESSDSDDSDPFPAGEYVALTVRTPASLGADDAWLPDADARRPLLRRLRERLEIASVRWAYVRQLQSESSITILLARAEE